MASVKVKFRPSSIDGKEGSIYYQVIHKRVARHIRTDYRIFESEWNRKLSRIEIPAILPADRKYNLRQLIRQVNRDVGRLESVIRDLSYKGSYTTDAIISRFREISESQSFYNFMESVIAQLGRLNRERTSETYSAALSSFMRFRQNKDVQLDDMDADLMMEYEAWLKDKGICPNSTSYYMRNLRAVYNRAVDRELTVQRSPFKHVYTGIDKTVKRAVPLKAVRMIRDLDLRLSPGMEYARDMFMLSFYTRGMSFVDIAYLKKADLKSGVLTYRRRKTGRRLSIKWEKPMQEILDRYGHNDSPYLFPVIRDTAKDAVRQYRSAAHFINGKLKELGKRLGLGMPLTMYVARHAWASIARSKNVPLATISEAMGHDSENTTRIYLASLDTSQVDKANDIILKSL